MTRPSTASPNRTPLRLADLQPGETGLVAHMPVNGSTLLRLQELGVVPGTAVRLVRMAPLGDPLEIEVRGCLLTVRRAEAALIGLA